VGKFSFRSKGWGRVGAATVTGLPHFGDGESDWETAGETVLESQRTLS
jgi:hypothetical protein